MIEQSDQDSEAWLPSIMERLRMLLIRLATAGDDPRRIGRALLAWTYNLTRAEAWKLDEIARKITKGRPIRSMSGAIVDKTQN